MGLDINFGAGIKYVSSIILNNPGVIKNLISPIIGGLHDGEQEWYPGQNHQVHHGHGLILPPQDSPCCTSDAVQGGLYPGWQYLNLIIVQRVIVPQAPRVGATMTYPAGPVIRGSRGDSS